MEIASPRGRFALWTHGRHAAMGACIYLSSELRLRASPQPFGSWQQRTTPVNAAACSSNPRSPARSHESRRQGRAVDVPTRHRRARGMAGDADLPAELMDAAMKVMSFSPDALCAAVF